MKVLKNCLFGLGEELNNHQITNVASYCRGAEAD
jgi:hypothetical protein